jgi:hypothetical protein
VNIQKAAVRASNNAMRGYIPHNAIVYRGRRLPPGSRRRRSHRGARRAGNGKGLQR